MFKLCGKLVGSLRLSCVEAGRFFTGRLDYQNFVGKSRQFSDVLYQYFTQLLHIPGGQVTEVNVEFYPLCTGPINKTTRKLRSF